MSSHHTDKLPGGLADDKTPSDFDPHDVAHGTEHEMEHTSDPSIAAEIAMDHLTEDPEYYIKLDQIEKAESKEARRARNAKPHNRAARRAYNKTKAGKAANTKAQYNYRAKHPDRYKAQQKARTDGESGHKCARCGKPAKHKHHLSYDDHSNYQWLCHAHHVKAHHPRSNMTKSSFVIPQELQKSESASSHFHIRTDLLAWVRQLAKTHPDSELAKSLACAEEGKINTMDVNDEHGDRIRYWDTVKMGVALTQALLQFISEDDKGAWETLPEGPRLRLWLKEMMEKGGTPDISPLEKSTETIAGLEENTNMKKSELHDAIRGNDVDGFVKSLNSIERGLPGSGHKETGQERVIATQGGASGDGRFDKEARSGMPGANGGSEQKFSDDDANVSAQPGSGSSMEQAAGGGAGGSGGGLEQTAKQDKDPKIKKSAGKQWTQGHYTYSTHEDEYISKAMDSQGCIETEPTLGFPNSPLTSQHSCINTMCKSAYAAYLTKCPDCGVDRTAGALHKSYRGVIIDQNVAKRLRPSREENLKLPAGVIVE